MEELYQAIEEKIKASGYPREISGERSMMISVIRSKEKKTERIWYFPNLRKMWYLSYHIPLFLMTTLIWEF